MTTVTLNITAPSFVAPAIKTERDFENYIRDFNNAFTSNGQAVREAMGQLMVAKHSYVYNLIAEAAAMAVVMLDPANAKYLANALKVRDYDPVPAGRNRYLDVVHVLFGKWKDVTEGVNKREWKFDRSAEKYANVLRYLADNGIKPEHAAAKIVAFDKKLLGMELADRKAHSTKDQSIIDVTNAFDGLKKGRAICRLGNDRVLSAIGERTTGAIWFTIDEDEIHLKGVLDLSPESLDAILLRMAKANLRAKPTTPPAAPASTMEVEVALPAKKAKSRRQVAAAA